MCQNWHAEAAAIWHALVIKCMMLAVAVRHVAVADQPGWLELIALG